MKLLKLALLIILLNAVVFSVENFGAYGDKFLIRADSYVLKLPQNLADRAVVNNGYEINLIPSVSIDGKSFTIAPSIQQGMVSGSKSSYSFKVSTEKEGMQIEEKVRIEGKKIVSEVTFKSKREKEARVSIYLPLVFEDKKIIFLADNYKNNSRYLVVTDTDFEGSSLGVSFSQPIDLKNQRQITLNTSDYSVKSEERELKKGQSFSIKVVYYPFNLQLKRKTSFPLAYSCFLENSFVKTSGAVEEFGSVDDKLKQVLDELSETSRSGTGEFVNEHDVNLNSLSDSLDYSIYAKKKLALEGVPVKLVIGKKGNFKYAWVSAYLGKWVDIDAFKAVEKKPVGYRIVFTEPELELHTYSNKPLNRNIYLSTVWLKKTQENNFLSYLIFLLVTGAAVTLFINLKSKAIEKRIETPGIEKQDLNGKYEILKEEKTEQEFINEIFSEIKKSNGEVNLEKIADKFHYSKELVSFAIAYLIDNRFIRRTGESAVLEKKNAVKFSLKQKIAVAVISISALILIIYLLI